MRRSGSVATSREAVRGVQRVVRFYNGWDRQIGLKKEGGRGGVAGQELITERNSGHSGRLIEVESILKHA